MPSLRSSPGKILVSKLFRCAVLFQNDRRLPRRVRAAAPGGRLRRGPEVVAGRRESNGAADAREKEYNCSSGVSLTNCSYKEGMITQLQVPK